MSRSATLEDSAKELARKIAAALPAQANVTCEVRNISSLRPAEADRVTQALKEEFLALGVHEVSSDSSTISVLVTLSQNLQGFVWTGEIRQGDSSRVVLVQAFVSRENSGTLLPRITLQDEKFWEGPEHILDAALMDSPSGSPLLALLTPDYLLISANEPGLATKVPFPPVQSVSRDPAGHLTQSGNELIATFVQQTCTVALDMRSLIECHPAESPAGRTDTLLQLIPPGSPHPEWGSPIAKIQTNCGTGSQFLVTGAGDYTQRDSVQLYGSEETRDSPGGNPLSNPLSFAGPVLSLHAAGAGATAIVHDLETGNYEAHHISVTCEQ